MGLKEKLSLSALAAGATAFTIGSAVHTSVSLSDYITDQDTPGWKRLGVGVLYCFGYTSALIADSFMLSLAIASWMVKE